MVTYTSDEINQVITNAHCYISKLALRRIDDIIERGSSFLEERFFYLMYLMIAIEDRAPFDISDSDFQQIVSVLDSEVGICNYSIDPTYIFIYNSVIVPLIRPLTFLQLSDVPKSYLGQAGKVVVVGGDENGLIFVSPDSISTPNIIRIIDSIIPFIPLTNIILYIINRGDKTIYYIPLGGSSPVPLSSGQIYNFIYDGNPITIPNVVFTDDYFYSLQPDGISDSLSTFLKSTDATLLLNQFTQSFLADYILSNGNADLNIKNKNLIVSITVGKRASLTQLQIKDGSTVIYDNLLTSELLHLGSELGINETVKAVVASTDPTLQIAVEAKNISGILYKTQNFLSTDTDNNLIAPVRISIS